MVLPNKNFINNRIVFKHSVANQNSIHSACFLCFLQGFDEVRKGCCGTGAVETASVLCNPKSHETCSNATKYMFWDSVHPSEAANQILADAMIVQGYALI